MDINTIKVGDIILFSEFTRLSLVKDPNYIVETLSPLRVIALRKNYLIAIVEPYYFKVRVRYTQLKKRCILLTPHERVPNLPDNKKP